jgi:hypothetical protein
MESIILSMCVFSSRVCGLLSNFIPDIFVDAASSYSYSPGRVRRERAEDRADPQPPIRAGDGGLYRRHDGRQHTDDSRGGRIRAAGAGVGLLCFWYVSCSFSPSRLALG